MNARPIRFAHDSVIDNDDDAVVSLGSNQTADSLPQLQDRFGERIFSKRIAASSVARGPNSRFAIIVPAGVLVDSDRTLRVSDLA